MTARRWEVVLPSPAWRPGGPVRGNHLPTDHFVVTCLSSALRETATGYLGGSHPVGGVPARGGP